MFDLLKVVHTKTIQTEIKRKGPVLALVPQVIRREFIVRSGIRTALGLDICGTCAERRSWGKIQRSPRVKSNSGQKTSGILLGAEVVGVLYEGGKKKLSRCILQLLLL